MPSPPILATLGRVLEIDLALLLDLTGAPTPRATHLLLYQTGSDYPSPLAPARRLFAGRVDAWIEIVDPRRPPTSEPPPVDVLVQRRRHPSRSRLLGDQGPTDLLVEALAEIPPSSTPPSLGIVFGASSSLLRSLENPQALLDSETTWEDDVRAKTRAALAVEPNANVCVYREADIEELSAIDPLATLVSLLKTHSHVAVQEGNKLTTGPTAIERILATVRPAGVSSQTWQTLTRATAAGFTRYPTRDSARPEHDQEPTAFELHKPH
jgi:hypothetical protein